MRNSYYIIPSKTIESYLITRDKTQVKKLSLTSGASWIHSPAEEFMHGHEIHSVARDNRDLLNIGHAFWLEKITGINPEDRNAVNQALTPYLTTLKEIIQNGVAQETQASVKHSLSDLEKSLRNTPSLVKDTLRGQIQEEEAAIPPNSDEILKIKKAQLQQKIALLDNYKSLDDSADSTTTEQPTPSAIKKTRVILTNLFNRNKCAHLLKITMPRMQQNGTANFVDLLGYCIHSLEEAEGRYQDPEKIDTLMGVLSECALSYSNSASCADGIRERCQRDGYMIRESQARDETALGVSHLLTQIREHYAENKLMATSDEPSPLLGLLIMDTILKKHGITTWSVCGEEENRRKLENLSPTSWQELQDYLGTEKEKLTAELAELNKINKTSQEETGLAKVKRLRQMQTVAHKRAVLEEQLDTLHGIERNRSQDSDSNVDPHHQSSDLSRDDDAPSTNNSVEHSQLSSNASSKPKGKSISISVEESLITLNNLIQKRTLLDLTVLAPETKQALQGECDALEEIIDKMTSSYEAEQADKNQNSAVFTQYHQAMIEDLSHTLSSYGLTYEHSRTVILTACLTQDFDKLNDSNIPAQYSYWALAYQQATGYLNTLAQQSIPTTSGLYEPNEDYQQNVQAKVVAEWLTPLHAMQNKLLLQEPEELVATLSNKEKILVLPATCQDQEQADAILAFMQNPAIMAHYLDNDTTLLSGLGGNDLVLETLFNQQIAEESPDWSTIQDTFFHIVQGCTTNTADKVITTLHDKHPETLLSQNNKQQTALGLALEHRRVDIAHKLIDILATDSIEALTCPDIYDKTPLHIAIEKGHTDIALKLIGILATQSIKALYHPTEFGKTPLHIAIEKGNTDITLKLIDILKKQDIKAFTYPSEFDLTPLHTAINKDHTDIALKLIDILEKKDIKALTYPSNFYLTPINRAIEKGNTDIALKLIDILATHSIEALTCLDKFGNTPLHLAIEKGHTDIAHNLSEILEKKNIKGLNCPGEYDRTPLHLAIEKGHTDIAHNLIDILEKKNIERLNCPGEYGRTPLQLAIWRGRTDIAKQLIDILEKKDIKALTCLDKFGNTPLHLAIIKGHTDIVLKLIDILEKHSIETLTSPNKFGITPLRMAINIGDTDTAIKLINIMENHSKELFRQGHGVKEELAQATRQELHHVLPILQKLQRKIDEDKTEEDLAMTQAVLGVLSRWEKRANNTITGLPLSLRYGIDHFEGIIAEIKQEPGNHEIMTRALSACDRLIEEVKSMPGKTYITLEELAKLRENYKSMEARHGGQYTENQQLKFKKEKNLQAFEATLLDTKPTRTISESALSRLIKHDEHSVHKTAICPELNANLTKKEKRTSSTTAAVKQNNQGKEENNIHPNIGVEKK